MLNHAALMQTSCEPAIIISECISTFGYSNNVCHIHFNAFKNNAYKLNLSTHECPSESLQQTKTTATGLRQLTSSIQAMSSKLLLTAWHLMHIACNIICKESKQTLIQFHSAWSCVDRAV